MKRWIAPVLAVALLGVLAGCSAESKSSAPAQSLELTAVGMAFGTKSLTVEKGKAYDLVFKNTDTMEHDFAIDKIPVKMAKDDHKGDSHGSGAKKADLHVHAAAGKTESVAFTATEAGTYNFYCTIPGHKEAGMVGKLTVQ